MNHTEPVEKAIYFLTEDDVYQGNHPWFYEPADYPWVKTLESNWTAIRDEIFDNPDGKRDINLTSVNPPYLSSPNSWKNAYFYNFMWKKHENCKRFPKTYEILKSIPNLIFAEITILEPHSEVLPHIGETNTTIRGHLGIKIPAKLPTCGIKVGEDQRSWKEGKVVLFSDAHRHTVWNHSDEQRFVLVFDVLRDEFAKNKFWVSASALGALTVKYVDEHLNLFKRLPKFVINSAHFIFTLMWFLYLPIQRRLSFL